jgi:hypothetical protein
VANDISKYRAENLATPITVQGLLRGSDAGIIDAMRLLCLLLAGAAILGAQVVEGSISNSVTRIGVSDGKYAYKRWSSREAQPACQHKSSKSRRRSRIHTRR